jgi:hypothetical protein
MSNDVLSMTENRALHLLGKQGKESSAASLWWTGRGERVLMRAV